MNAGRDEDDDALWSAYLDGTLEPQARARADARLRTSAADRETLEAMRVAAARLRATAVPDPGAAYWRDFGARVESRLQPAAESRSDPALIYEKLVGWLVNGGRVRWVRAAGALAGLTLVTYIGMRGFRPSDVRMPPAEVPKQDLDVHGTPEPTASFRVDEPVVDPPAETKLRAERGDAAAKSEAEATLPQEKRAIESQSEAVAELEAPSPREQVEEGQLGSGRVDATQPRSAPAPQSAFERLGTNQVVPKPMDSGAADLHVRGGRASDVLVSISPPGADSKQVGLDERTADVPQRGAADSLASYLAQALREDAPRTREGAALRAAAPRVNQLNETAPGVVGKPTASAPAPPPIPPPSPATAEVDRLLQLADLAQRYETDPTFRPHLETIAIRLSNYARQDPRAASRARALMRTLAASSATASDRAAWEDHLRQLPP